MWTSTVAHSSGHGSPLIKGCVMCYYHHILRSSIQLRSFSLLGGGEFTNTTLKIRGPCSMQWMLAVRTSLVISAGDGSDIHAASPHAASQGKTSDVMWMKICGPTESSGWMARRMRMVIRKGWGATATVASDMFETLLVIFWWVFIFCIHRILYSFSF